MRVITTEACPTGPDPEQVLELDSKRLAHPGWGEVRIG